MPASANFCIFSMSCFSMAFSMRRTAIRRKSSINQIRTSSARKSQACCWNFRPTPPSSRIKEEPEREHHQWWDGKGDDFVRHQQTDASDGQFTQCFQCPFCVRDQPCKRPSKREEQKHDAEQQRQPNDHQEHRPTTARLAESQEVAAVQPRLSIPRTDINVSLAELLNHRGKTIQPCPWLFHRASTVLATESIACSCSDGDTRSSSLV